MKGAAGFPHRGDGEVESAIRERLAEAFPGDGFIGEEEAARDADSDPGSSTRSTAPRTSPAGSRIVASRSPFCAGEAAIGVIYDPAHDQLYAARRGRGATLDGEIIQVSGRRDIAPATVEAGWSTRVPLELYVGVVARLKQAGAAVRRGGSGRARHWPMSPPAAWRPMSSST